MTIKVAGRQRHRNTSVFVFYRVFDHIVQSQVPSALVKRRNPWFDYLMRRLYRRSPRLPKKFRRSTFKWGCIIPFAIALAGCLMALVARTSYGILHLSDIALWLMGLGFFGSLGISLMLDMYYAV